MAEFIKLNPGALTQLPCLCGETVSGKLELAPGSCAFILV